MPEETESEHVCVCDDELSIINHACDYLNEADDRAKERLLFYLTHRFFPEGSFSPKRLPL